MSSDSESENSDISVNTYDEESEEELEEELEEEDIVSDKFTVNNKFTVNKKNHEIDIDEEFVKNALEQIAKMEELESKTNNVKLENVGIKMTTDGLSQDECKTVNLAKIKNIIQCDWCGNYFSNEIVIRQNDVNVCKHCMFSVNHNENLRLQFDTECVSKGTSIALYIIECKDEHNMENCKKRPDCYLCDYKNGIPIKNILNPEMIELDETGLRKTITQKKPINSVENTFEHKVNFNGDDASFKNIKVPNKLQI